jgi:hypothetical protein
MKVKIKTKKQFKEDGLWDKELNHPPLWNHQGKMDYLFGQTVEVEKNKECSGYSLTDGIGWTIYNEYIAEIIEE